MIILDKPYVSEFLKQTLIQNQIPVLKSSALDELNIVGNYNYLAENVAILELESKPEAKIYTNSENAIDWISKNLNFTDIPAKINLFKDKIKFRELLNKMYPEFYFKPLSINEFDRVDIQKIPKPFIIKPSVGFFSMGVYKVNSDAEWCDVKDKIKEELVRIKGLYPKEVLDIEKFIIEQVIDGDEYAIDVYFDEIGQAVVLNIMHHVFSSGNDFSDRLYITSEKIIREKLSDFEFFMNQIGKLAKLKNFPVHVEVRINADGKIIPIEINPLRFGAWCTTADLAWFAYGNNSIVSYLKGEKPDWEELLSQKKGKIYAMMVLENSTGYKAEQIKSFNSEKLWSDFEKPIEFRRIDYHKYPVFGFLFVETRSDNFTELEKILKSDLTEYIELNDRLI